MGTKLNHNAENILKMLQAKTPEEMAQMLDVILDDLASTVDNRAVAEFHFTEVETNLFIASQCYVTPPAKGEYIKIKETLFEIVNVMHSFDRSKEPGKHSNKICRADRLTYLT